MRKSDFGPARIDQCIRLLIETTGLISSHIDVAGKYIPVAVSLEEADAFVHQNSS